MDFLLYQHSSKSPRFYYQSVYQQSLLLLDNYKTPAINKTVNITANFMIFVFFNRIFSENFPQATRKLKKSPVFWVLTISPFTVPRRGDLWPKQVGSTNRFY
jgi:hypothetical protein